MMKNNERKFKRIKRRPKKEILGNEEIKTIENLLGELDERSKKETLGIEDLETIEKFLGRNLSGPIVFMNLE